MKLDEFDFDLPEDRIALHPAMPKDQARLLAVNPQRPPLLQDRIIRDLPDLLSPGDALVVNDTRVIPAQLKGIRRRAGAAADGPVIHVTLHQHTGQNSGQNSGLPIWRAFARPARKLAQADRIEFLLPASDDQAQPETGSLTAHITRKLEGGEIELAFSCQGAALEAGIARFGTMPLPPYIASRRPVETTDARDYQTLFASAQGACAAPTAGLHFTPALIDRLQARNITFHTVTLHVGAGTFLPVKTDRIADHKMHAERAILTADTASQLNRIRARGNKVIAVGTTSLRVLESAADATGTLHEFNDDTRIFITPGYSFRTVDRLLTNFHLPKSTLFMLVSAFSGLATMKAAYAHAIAARYRFYSYGDACLLDREMPA